MEEREATLDRFRSRMSTWREEIEAYRAKLRAAQEAEDVERVATRPQGEAVAPGAASGTSEREPQVVDRALVREGPEVDPGVEPEDKPVAIGGELAGDLESLLERVLEDEDRVEGLIQELRVRDDQQWREVDRRLARESQRLEADLEKLRGRFAETYPESA